ncbi:hypothetical protein ACQ4PT_068922 [Festuca glaucescens]
MNRPWLCHSRPGDDLPFVRRFKPREIEAATSGFSTALETGGPRGTAYRARFADGLVATVRRVAAATGTTTTRSRTAHSTGSCSCSDASTTATSFLVFDQMENRSLMECLHDPLRTPLNWRTRLQVAVDVAAALEYLYYFCDPPVFHVTVNSSSVMMDADFVAKLSDVSVVAHDSTQESQGSRHHFYHHPCQVCTDMSDTEAFPDRCVFFLQSESSRGGTELVFHYGVLLLELVTGQSPGGGDGELVRWVQEPGFAGSMQRMVDADLGGTYDAGELRDLVIVARLCTRPGNGSAVVSIPQVLRYLQGKVDGKNR